MQSDSKHRKGIEQFQQGVYSEAVRLFSEALLEKENCELWNDWATAQAASGHIEEAKKGYRRALQLNAGDSQSAANLGALLCGEGGFLQAIPLLEQSLDGLDDIQRNNVQKLLKHCRKQTRVMKKAAGI